MRSLLLIAHMALAISCMTSNMATCLLDLLDKLPGVKNAPAHTAALNLRSSA